MLNITLIDGAAIMPDITKLGRGMYQLPEVDDRYRYFTSDNDDQKTPLVSEDCVNWVIPIGVIYKGQRMKPQELAKTLERGSE